MPRDRGPRTEDWCFTSFNNDLPVASIAGDEGVQYFVVQREKCPETSRDHWQGFVQFKARTYRTRVQGLIGDNTAHCKVRMGTSEEAAEYCKKSDSRVSEDQRYEFGELIKKGRPVKKGRDGDVIRAVCGAAHKASSRAEALEIIEQGAPDLLFRSHFSVLAELKRKFPEHPAPFIYQPHWAWNLPAAITNWLSTEFTKTERAKCLVLIGPTRIGKTNWARSLGRHMFWRTNVAYGEWDQEARYIVIDDIPWKYVPHKKGILTQMGQITLTDKYVKKITVLNDKPAIFLTNDNVVFDDDDINYWRENTTVVCLNEKLFNENQLAINF